MNDKQVPRRLDGNHLQIKAAIIRSDPEQSRVLARRRLQNRFGGRHDVQGAALTDPVPSRRLAEPDNRTLIMCHTITLRRLGRAEACVPWTLWKRDPRR